MCLLSGRLEQRHLGVYVGWIGLLYNIMRRRAGF